MSLKAANGKYVSTADPADALTVQSVFVGDTELFEWLRLPNGDVALRAVGGGGQLIQRNSTVNLLYPSADNGLNAAANFVIVNTPGGIPAPLIGNPFYGAPLTVPGLIQAEDFDFGGEGQGYHDNDAGNNGGKYRTLDDVDIESSIEPGGGYNVGWLGAGEWMAYTIDVDAANSGDYRLTTRVATQNSGGAFSVEFDGINRTGDLAVPNTGGWQNWTDVTTTVTLDPGVQMMRFLRAGNAEFNVNNFTLTKVGDYDFNGVVDGADLLAWQRTDGKSAGLNGWQKNYGSQSNRLAATAVIPEPATSTLAPLLGLTAQLICRDRLVF